MVLYMITMIALLLSSDALWNISSTNQTVTNMSTTNILMVSTLNSTAYYNSRPKSLNDKIAAYTIKPPYLYIFIAVLSLIVISCIVCCIVLYRNRNIKRRVSEPPKPIEFEFAVTGHSLGKSKKHSINLKILPALAPNNSHEDQPEEEEISTEEHETCSEEEEQEETNKTVVHNDYAYDNTLNVPETLELQNVNTLEMQNHFMSFSEREYENEWYDPTFTVDNFGKSVLLKKNNMSDLEDIDDESVTEHLRE
eukprot:UN03728